MLHLVFLILVFWRRGVKVSEHFGIPLSEVRINHFSSAG